MGEREIVGWTFDEVPPVSAERAGRFDTVRVRVDDDDVEVEIDQSHGGPLLTASIPRAVIVELLRRAGVGEVAK